MDVHYPLMVEPAPPSSSLRDQRFADVVEERSVWLPTIEAYQPGRFYLRELPAIAGVLATTAMAGPHRIPDVLRHVDALSRHGVRG